MVIVIRRCRKHRHQNTFISRWYKYRNVHSSGCLLELASKPTKKSTMRFALRLAAFAALLLTSHSDALFIPVKR